MREILPGSRIAAAGYIEGLKVGPGLYALDETALNLRDDAAVRDVQAAVMQRVHIAHPEAHPEAQIAGSMAYSVNRRSIDRRSRAKSLWCRVSARPLDSACASSISIPSSPEATVSRWTGCSH